ncbi:hypothetical protein BGZ49_004492 [Haplosporangium sp. Z 27]|nr:hypothetical protein BGZ49_004492 [Haplosporangium sp. Z 27]
MSMCNATTDSLHSISRIGNTEAWEDFEYLRSLYNPLTSREPYRSQSESEWQIQLRPNCPAYNQPENYVESPPTKPVTDAEPRASQKRSGFKETNATVHHVNDTNETGVLLAPLPFRKNSNREKLRNAPTLRLLDADLWGKFHSQQNEMIITKSGRCLFPCLRFKAVNLDPEAMYTIRLDFEMTDPRRFRFSNCQWTPVKQVTRFGDSSDDDTAHSNILSQESYIHSSGCQTGSDWMKTPISFAKVKLSNNGSNPLDNQPGAGFRSANSKAEDNHIFHVKSFHKYQPRLHLIQRSRDSHAILFSKSFTFDQTKFIAVTHYQNNRVNDLKKGFNPHAKGFRNKAGQGSSSHRKLSRFNNNLEPGLLGTRKTSTTKKKPRLDISSSSSSSDLSDEDDGSDSEDPEIDDECNLNKKGFDLPVTKPVTQTKGNRPRALNHSCQVNKSNRSIITITIAKSNEKTSKRSLVRKPSNSANEFGYGFNQETPLQSDEMEGTMAQTFEFRNTQSQGLDHNFPSSGYEPVSSPPYREVGKNGWEYSPSIIADQFYRLQELMATNPPICDTVNAPAPPSIPHMNNDKGQSLSIFSKTATGNENDGFKYFNSSISSIEIPEQSATTSWYQQFLRLDQPSADMSLIQSEPPITNIDTEGHVGSYLQLTSQPAMNQSSRQPSTSNQAQPSDNRHKQHQVMHLLPYSPLSTPLTNMKCQDTQNDINPSHPSIPGSQLTQFIPDHETDGPGTWSGEYTDQTSISTNPKISRATILESKTSMSTSSVISLSPFSAYSGQARLERAIRENDCLKGFIRERYGREAEADANAVIAMQCYE